MAKKVSIKTKNIHKDCVMCKEEEKEFLSINGEPILGSCEYNETRFLLREKTDCKNFKYKV